MQFLSINKKFQAREYFLITDCHVKLPIDLNEMTTPIFLNTNWIKIPQKLGVSKFLTRMKNQYFEAKYNFGPEFFDDRGNQFGF